MNRSTGTPITTADHIRQSIGDILNTPVGTRVMRRDYGSHVFDLVDAPGNPAGALRVVAAAADAIERWEPRAELRRGSLRTDANGRAVLNLDLITTADASPITAEIPVGQP
jgi:hypothetical protein